MLEQERENIENLRKDFINEVDKRVKKHIEEWEVNS